MNVLLALTGAVPVYRTRSVPLRAAVAFAVPAVVGGSLLPHRHHAWVSIVVTRRFERVWVCHDAVFVLVRVCGFIVAQH